MNDEPAIITLEGFHKAYGATVAVAGLDLTVQACQILGLVGPNGAGKTSTLRALAGLVPPTRGRLSVTGHDVVRASTAAKSVLAYVPDDPKLFDTLTIWEHLRFTAAAYRVATFEVTAAALLGQFELTGKRNTACQELSRGMRQKVAICCALLRDPRAILFDEPLTGLDPRGIRTLKQAIVERAAAGAAIILSSHLLSLVEDLCSHYLILHHGRKLFFGSLAEARTAFADLRRDASLEEIFLRATEEPASPSSPV